MIYGLDYLGGAKYGNLILKEHPNGWAAGFFSYVDGFGDSLPVVDKLLATGRCPLVRIHLMWKDKHDFSEKDIPKIVSEAKRVAKLIVKYPSVEFRVSPCCEHGQSESFMVKVFGAIAPILSRAIPVNTPLHGKGAVLKSYINEFHGADKKPRASGRHMFSFDGTACVDANITEYKESYKDTEVFFFWDARFNGRWEDVDKTPRAKRTGYPDSNLIDSIIYLHRDKGQTKIEQRNAIYKSHSENKGSKDPRAEKPVFISTSRAKEITLVASNGQTVGTFRYYGTFPGNRHRYYASEMGYQLAEKAKRIQNGNPVVNVFVNKRKIGFINPAFRDGSFR